MRIYDDSGSLQETASAIGPYPWRTGIDGIAIGNNPANTSGLRGALTAGPEPFNGIVDEVRVYNVVISDAQIDLDRMTPLP